MSQYLESGKKHTINDQVIGYEKLQEIQRTVNGHSDWLRKIFGLGSSWSHEDRHGHSMTDRGEVVAPLYLLIKDHKGWSFENGTAPPSRPVCSGNQGFNRHLSEILSMILEPVGHAVGGSDIDSTGGLLEKIDALNDRLNSNDQALNLDHCNLLDRTPEGSSVKPSLNTDSQSCIILTPRRTSAKPSVSIQTVHGKNSAEPK